MVQLTALIRKLRQQRGRLNPPYQRSYAQAGEDLIADFILRQILTISRPSYLDLGAHHPTHLSNTYLFYRRGASGVAIEPNRRLLEEFRVYRPRDTCVCSAVSHTNGRAMFYEMKTASLSTLSQDQASAYQRAGHELYAHYEVSTHTPSTLIERYCNGPPDLVSLDVEGFDLEILKVWNFLAHRPKVWIVEPTHAGKKPILSVMANHGYVTYADTFTNMIFVPEDVYRKAAIL